jgi:hypothetical protein
MKHRLDRAPRFKPLGKYRPRHCRGITPSGGQCLHEHADERRCACGQTIIPAGHRDRDLSFTLRIAPVDSNRTNPMTIRHSPIGCHRVTPASSSLAKAGA